MLLGYKKRFKEPILIGTKVHTMRKPRKIKPKLGETLYMYTALRTKHCELITNKETLRGIQKVRIVINRTRHSRGECSYNGILVVDGRKLTDKESLEFVRYDGFTSMIDFYEFWFIGITKNRVGGTLDLYHWTDLKY